MRWVPGPPRGHPSLSMPIRLYKPTVRILTHSSESKFWPLTNIFTLYGLSCLSVHFLCFTLNMMIVYSIRLNISCVTSGIFIHSILCHYKSLVPCGYILLQNWNEQGVIVLGMLWNNNSLDLYIIGLSRNTKSEIIIIFYDTGTTDETN